MSGDRPIQDAGASAVPQPEQCPALQQPRSPQSARNDGSALRAARARISAGTTPAVFLTETAALTCFAA